MQAAKRAHDAHASISASASAPSAPVSATGSASGSLLPRAAVSTTTGRLLNTGAPELASINAVSLAAVGTACDDGDQSNKRPRARGGKNKCSRCAGEGHNIARCQRNCQGCSAAPGQHLDGCFVAAKQRERDILKAAKKKQLEAPATGTAASV